MDATAVDDRHVFAASPDDVETAEIHGRGGCLFWGEAFFVRRELADGVRLEDRAAAARAACVLSVLGFDELAATCL